MNRYAVSLLVCLLAALPACGGNGVPMASPAPDTRITPAAHDPSPVATTPTPSPVPAATPTSTPPPLIPLEISRVWRYATLETVWSVIAEDLNGNGHKEVIAGSYDKHVYALAGDGNVIWRYRTRGPVHCLGTGDLDGDGRLEVVVGGDDNTVRALGAGGELLWERHIGSRVVAVAVADVTGDGGAEVLVGCQDGQLLMLGAEGDVLWRMPGEGPVSFVEWVDLDGDGHLEGLAGHQQGAVSLVSADGQVRWRHDVGGHVRELRAYDLDADGRREVVVGTTDGWLRVLSNAGALMWGRHLGAPVITLDVGDVDGDGQGEIVVGTGGSASKVVVLTQEGRERWVYPVPKAVWAVRALDLDGDGQLDVLVGGDDGNVRILDAYGRLRAVYETGRRVHGLSMGDTSGEGFVDLVARSGDDVHLLAVSLSGAQPEQWEVITEPPTLPHWRGTLPGLAKAGEGHIELVAVGDIMLSRTVEERIEVYGSHYPFEAVAELLRGADVVIGNLEAPFALHGEPLSKRFVFRVDPRHVDGLAWAGFDVVSLANNHLLDFGAEGLHQTLTSLRDSGVAYVGAGLSPEEAHRPLIWEVKGRRIAFLAYAATRWKGSYELPTFELVSFAELATVRAEVQRARELADLVVVIMHLGTEYQLAPDEEQLAVSRAAIDAGACLVIGHHSHVVQGSEVYRGGLIVYGLGNFIFDIDVVEAAREGAILRVLLGDQAVVSADLIPVRIVDDVQPQFMADETGLPKVRPAFRAPSG